MTVRFYLRMAVSGPQLSLAPNNWTSGSPTKSCQSILMNLYPLVEMNGADFQSTGLISLPL